VDGLPVAVEIAPPDAPREHVTALLSACSRALADSACVLSSDAPEDRSRAVAIVTWQGEGRVQIEVGLRRQGNPEWRSRTLDFDPKDEPAERWRTVGFVVGTLSRPELPPEDSGATSSDAPASPQEPLLLPAPEPEQKPAPPPPSRAARRDAARAVLDVGAVTGPALDSMRSGAVLRSRWRIAESLRAVVGVNYLALPAGERGLSAGWLTALAGVSALLGDQRAEVSFGLDARAEYLNARANGVSRSNVFPGVGLGVTGAWMPTTPFGVFAGAETALMFGTREIEFAPDRVVVDPALRLNVEAGVRLRLW